jgi:hypothetical protein
MRRSSIENRQSKIGNRSRSALLWALLTFAAGQSLFALAMERWRPAWRDREYGTKLGGLRRRLARQPGRPLALMLGSSRTFYGFRADRLDGRPGPDGRPLVAFNFGLAAAGPLKQSACLQGLLDEGIRPDLLLVEVLPPLLNEPGRDRFCEENWLFVPGLSAADVWRLRPYVSHPGRFAHAWLRSRLSAWQTHRARILADCGRCWLSPGAPAAPLDRMDGGGWVPAARGADSAEDRRRAADVARRQYAAAFADFRIGDGPARALRDLLERCRREKIAVALVLMPEGSTFRGWYPPAMEESVGALLAELGRSYGATVIDARTWVEDRDFWDAHHLLPGGADAFSRRLADAAGRAGVFAPPEHPP